MAGAGVEEEVEMLREWQATMMSRLRRALADDGEDEVASQARLERIVEGNWTTLDVGTLFDRALDERDHLRRARLQAIARLRDGGDHYAAAIVEGIA